MLRHAFGISKQFEDRHIKNVRMVIAVQIMQQNLFPSENWKPDDTFMPAESTSDNGKDDRDSDLEVVASPRTQSSLNKRKKRKQVSFNAKDEIKHLTPQVSPSQVMQSSMKKQPRRSCRNK